MKNSLFVSFGLMLILLAAGCTTTPAPETNPPSNPPVTPTTETYTVTSPRSCSTFPVSDLAGTVAFCKNFCENTLHLPYVNTSCASANPPTDFLKCTCEKKPNYDLTLQLTYACETKNNDAANCSNQCSFMGLVYGSSSCVGGTVSCTCIYE
ncbi:MAG: hypothetical protein HY832_01230 [Candidatus Aenigmarchaeota archaeon]|nr:hypothetical protein [Candidatus Aenigmarchaeota archaeon]